MNYEVNLFIDGLVNNTSIQTLKISNENHIEEKSILSLFNSISEKKSNIKHLLIPNLKIKEQSGGKF